MSLAQAFDEVERRMRSAAERSGRRASDVLLVAVTKKKDISFINEYEQLATSRGIAVAIGENYLQELKRKRPGLHPGSLVHMIGPLQSNKVRDAVALSDVIESVHSIKVLDLIARYARESGKRQEIFLQINIGHEAQKSGFSIEELGMAVRRAGELTSCISLKGLMAITPYCHNPGDARPYFRDMASIRERLRTEGLTGLFNNATILLSMGMSADFDVAIEEGADVVRVGTALFGER